VLCFAAAEAWPEPQGQVPADVVGTWETSDPRYAGRRLVLEEFAITSVADSSRETHSVERVAMTRRGDTLAVSITYGDPGAWLELGLVHLRGPREQLTLAHPAGLTWTRSSAGGTAAAAMR
ncbi:MAG: hypothetical protein H7066_11465, partial [Cytophagaceae bacterium]|nr:hypothetical protein [Gemmatimonadaceae bacterium]